MARREEARLLRKLDAIRHVIASYDEAQTDRVPSLSAQPVVRQTKPRAQSQASDVVRIAEVFLASIKRRAQSTEISAELERRGVSIGGKSPSSVVSSYLSNSDKFDNVRGVGYGLTAWKENEPISGSAVGSDAAEEGVQPPELGYE